MCGIIGGFTTNAKSDSLIEECLRTLQHRGPDAAKMLHEKLSRGHLYLGHTRLSILDLSDASVQPFQSSCGKYVLVFNGEIYNYKEIKRELEDLGIEFTTTSDTEVLLQALIQWDLSCLQKLIGMFAFAFYNKHKNTISIARDAFGIKPLYYSHTPDALIFASELRALTTFRESKVSANLQRAYDYLVHGDYDSQTETFVDNVLQLLPAQYVVYDISARTLSSPTTWWEPEISDNPEKLTFVSAKEKLRSLFLESLALHLRSDVPIGIALSGGIDSSAITTAVRHLDDTFPIKTFSYVSDDALLSEEKWIDTINEKTGALAHKVRASADELFSDIEQLVKVQGEPFSTTSIYAQYRVFKLAAQTGITVTLDGQGADELLAGYIGYPGHRLLSILETKGIFDAHKFAKSWSKFPNRNYTLAWKYLLRLCLPQKLYLLARKLTGRSARPTWLNLEYLERKRVVLHEARKEVSPSLRGQRVKEALKHSLKGRGLQSLLRHGDRNSMAASIESRVPFLTIPMAEFLFTLPEEYLISDDGITKNIFREAMRGIMPDSHIDRKDKIGFSTPEAEWLYSYRNVIRERLVNAQDIPIFRKDKLLREFDKRIKNGTRIDSQVWRWLNYTLWCQQMQIDFS